jgi:integrase/recombinase XerC
MNESKMRAQLPGFCQYLSAVRLFSEHTIRAYQGDVQEFFEPFFVGGLDAYLTFIYDKDLSKRSVARKFASVRSFNRYLKKKGLCKSSVLDDLVNPKQEKRLPHVLHSDDLTRLFEAPDLSHYLGIRDRCIIELLYSSGLRASELVTLDVEHVDFIQRLILVQGKGARMRRVPMTQVAAKNVLFYLESPLRGVDSNKHKRCREKKALFLNRFGERITTRSVQRIFTHYKMKLGIAVELTPHTIRHTFATHLLEKGLNLKSIQELLGHSNLQSTTVYTSVSMNLKAKTLRECHPLNKK